MKKIFLIFVAAVALSSVAASALFAEEKYRHTEQIGAETVTTDVVVTEVSPLEIKIKVRKELVSSKVTLYFETAAKYENNLFVYNCVDNFGNDVHGDVRLRSDGTALLLLFTFYPSKIDESIRVFYTQGQILLESMEQPQ